MVWHCPTNLLPFWQPSECTVEPIHDIEKRADHTHGLVDHNINCLIASGTFDELNILLDKCGVGRI